MEKSNSNFKTLHFEVYISVAPKIVFDNIISKSGFEAWTYPFSKTSKFEGKWEEGETLRFISLDENDQQVGMLAKLKSLKTSKEIIIEYVGYIKNGKDIYDDEQAKSIHHTMEKYFLTTENNGTRLKIESDVAPEHEKLFNECWPQSLSIIKKMSESNEV